MAKKKDEKDVLVVRDEKTGEISVVAGLNADGSPKRIPAKAENAQSFLQFDRHGDVLDNFFRNFFRQCREPSRFGFYRVAADQADKLLEVIKDLLKDPDGNKEMLAPHKVDTSGYEKKVQEEQSAEKQEQPEQKQDDEPKKQEEMEQKNEQNQRIYIFQLHTVGIIGVIHNIPASIAIFVFFIVIIHRASVIRIHSGILSQINCRIRTTFLSDIISIYKFRKIRQFYNLIFIM